jgi:hypothetical protein
MCDYCDCRSHPEIASLSADHERLLDHLAELRRAIDDGQQHRAEVVLARIHGLLDDHARREERGVFAELREADVDDDYLAAFEGDHAALHGLLDEMSRPEWQRPARAFADLLAEHILREESDLFPAAHQLLAPEQWAAVAAAIHEGVIR